MRHKPNINQRLIDYQTRKSVHINLTKSTHSELRIMLLKKGLSMQVVFDRLASMICDKNSYLLNVLDTIETEKKIYLTMNQHQQALIMLFEFNKSEQQSKN